VYDPVLHVGSKVEIRAYIDHVDQKTIIEQRLAHDWIVGCHVKVLHQIELWMVQIMVVELYGVFLVGGVGFLELVSNQIGQTLTRTPILNDGCPHFVRVIFL
jgi:hypothetical protein